MRGRGKGVVALIFGKTVMQSLNLPFGDQCLLPATIDKLFIPPSLCPFPLLFAHWQILCLFWLRIVAKNTRNLIRIGSYIIGGGKGRSRLLQTIAVFPNWGGSFSFLLLGSINKVCTRISFVLVFLPHHAAARVQAPHTSPLVTRAYNTHTPRVASR